MVSEQICKVDEETATGASNEVVCVVRDAGHQTQEGAKGIDPKEEELGGKTAQPPGTAQDNHC